MTSTTVETSSTRLSTPQLEPPTSAMLCNFRRFPAGSEGSGVAMASGRTGTWKHVSASNIPMMGACEDSADTARQSGHARGNAKVEKRRRS